MDADQGKLFVGGISWETTEEALRDYFGQYGDVVQANIMRDKTTGRPRGFGFVLFSDPSVIDRVLLDKHVLDGRPVEAKRAMSREEQQSSGGRSGNSNGGRNGGAAGGNIRTKKIFVGGLPPTLNDEGFSQYFESFGHVTEVVIMYDQSTQRPRGFGFVTFDSEDAVDRVVQNSYHDLNGKQVEVKRALPKEANPGMASRGGAGGGNYGSQNSYDSRMDSNRYMQPQSTGGAYPPYSSGGYGAAGYGYGPGSNGMGYGGYSGYGGANAGYGAAAASAYGNPNVPGAGYGNAAAQRSQWNAQTASAYGAGAYGSAGAWNASGAGATGPAVQSPSGASGYGNQGYGYGNYGGADAAYGSRGAPGGASGGASGEQGGYGSGYADGNGHGGYGSGNYAAQTNGGQMGYGGGYGGAQNRQPQQQ